MVFRKKYVYGALFIILLLLFSACTHTVEDNTGSQEKAKNDLTLVAGFSGEDGLPLGRDTVRLSAGGIGTDYPLDEEGRLQVTGLPRSGELLLTLFDPQQEVQGTMTLFLDQGAVIDAATSEDGVGYITVREDTDEVALLFVLTENGALQCTLWLTESVSSDAELPQKGV